MDGSRSFFISPSSLLLLLFLLAAGLRGIYEGRSSRGQVQVHAGTRLRSWTNYRWRRGEVTGNVRTGERDRATFHSDTQYERTVSRVDGNSVFPRWRGGGGGGKRRKKGATIKLSSFRSTRNVHSKLIRWENFQDFLWNQFWGGLWNILSRIISSICEFVVINTLLLLLPKFNLYI